MSALPLLHHRPEVDAEVYRPLSVGHRFWLRLLRPILAPERERESLLTRAIALFFVVPFAPLTPLDLDYQTYLYEVFHRTWLARFIHFCLFPMVNLAVMAGLASVTFGPHAAANSLDPFAWNLAGLFALGLAAFYVAVAARVGSAQLGVVSVLVVGLVWMLANASYSMTFEPVVFTQGERASPPAARWPRRSGRAQVPPFPQRGGHERSQFGGAGTGRRAV